MKQLLLIIISLLFLNKAESQISIQEESSVKRFMSDYLSLNAQSTTVKAWRVQIITTNDRRKMEQSLSKFASLYPELETDWTHENPYYKVKVGAFETKEELQSFLLEVKQQFPSAIPVVDDIEKTELVE